jgi:hypothetical protein
MKRTILGLVAAVAIAFPATASAHGGRPVDVFTATATGTASVPFQGACPGSTPGIVTVDFHDMFHVTAFADGHVAIAANQAGAFSFQPFDPAQPTSSGHYRNGNVNVETQNGGVFHSVFAATGKFESGDHLRFLIHQTFVFADGEVRVDNFEVLCG